MAITQSATFTQILWNLADNFYTRILDFWNKDLFILEYIKSNGTQLLHQKFGTFEIIACIAYPRVPRL